MEPSTFLVSASQRNKFIRLKPNFVDHPSELVAKGFCNVVVVDDTALFKPEDVAGMSEAVDWTNSDACC